MLHNCYFVQNAQERDLQFFPGIFICSMVFMLKNNVPKNGSLRRFYKPVGYFSIFI